MNKDPRSSLSWRWQFWMTVPHCLFPPLIADLLDGISFTSVTTDSVQLMWDASPVATSYDISYISQDTTTAEVMSTPASQSMALVSNLQPQTLYTFSVVAVAGSARINVGSVSTATGMYWIAPKKFRIFEDTIYNIQFSYPIILILVIDFSFLVSVECILERMQVDKALGTFFNDIDLWFYKFEESTFC